VTEAIKKRINDEDNQICLLAGRRLFSRSFGGFSKEELLENLRDLLADIESGEVPYIRKVEELVLA